MRRLAIIVLALALTGAACSKSQNTTNQNGVPVTNERSGSTGGNFNGGSSGTNANAGQSNTNANAVLRTAIVKITHTGAVPKQLAVVSGTVVAFVNEDSIGHWIASDPHPVHTDLSGFDAGSAIAPGSTYTFTFARSGTWSYHDHLDASNTLFQGSVVVAAP